MAMAAAFFVAARRSAVTGLALFGRRRTVSCTGADGENRCENDQCEHARRVTVENAVLRESKKYNQASGL